MDKYEQKAIRDIDDYGCHILHVMEEEGFPSFSYSIGIERTSARPELIVTGLKRELAHSIVNRYNTNVRDGDSFEPNKYYSGFIGNHDVTFKTVEKKHYREYFGWGNWFYKGDDFRALQLIYPSTSGIWPWDKNAPEDFTWYLPKLYAG